MFFKTTMYKMKKNIAVLILLLSIEIFYAQSPKQAKLLYQWQDTTLKGSSQYNNTYNEVYSVYNKNGEYAIIGSTFGTHFIDVKTGKEVARVKGAAVGPEIVHRDYKKYKNYIYAVCDEGNSSLQIMDYSNLPNEIKVVYDSRELIVRTHNIFIDTAKARLYGCYTYNAKDNFKALKIIDISEPENPKQLANYNSINGFPLNSGGVHDAYVKNHIAFLNCGRGLAIVDFTNLTTPKLVYSITDYVDRGYNHSGWLSEDGNHYYFADENYGYKLKVLDATKYPEIKITSAFNCESTKSYSIAHNQYVKGDYLYVSYYFDGLQVFDIKDRNNPKRALHYPTSDRTKDTGPYQGAWGVNPDLPSGKILVSDMQNGLYIFEEINKTLTSTKELKKEIIASLYPNPSSGKFKIQCEDCKPKHLEMYDLMGRVYKKNVVDNEVDVRDIPRGFYMVRVYDEDERAFVKSIVVE